MTAREVKQYEERLEEIITVAQGLFAEEGYDKVSIQKIINKVGIAKGTFYHYFASKDELLNEMVIRFSKALVEELSEITNDSSLNAVEKLNRLMIQGVTTKLNESYSDVLKVIMAVMQNPANMLLVQKIQMSAELLVSPIYSAIIKQGSEEGAFDIQYYDEAAEMVLGISKSLQKKFHMLFTLTTKDEIIAEFYRLMEIFQSSIARLLGADEEIIIFVTPETARLMSEFCHKIYGDSNS